MNDREPEEEFRQQAESVITAAKADAVWTLDEAGLPEALFAWTATSQGTSRPGEEITVAH